jgi:hypothetical protein
MEKKINHNAIPPCRRLCRRQVDLRKKKGEGRRGKEKEGEMGFWMFGRDFVVGFFPLPFPFPFLAAGFAGGRQCFVLLVMLTARWIQ